MKQQSDHHPDHTVTVSEDEKTVWINGAFNCLGRFSPNGFEINRRLTLDSKMGDVSTGTLAVKIKTLVSLDWDSFKTLMKQHHGIDLSEVDNPLL